MQVRRVLMLVCGALSVGLIVSTAVAAERRVEVVEQPRTEASNPHYVGNREPLTPSPLLKLPVGQVKPKGWLKKQLELQAGGYFGHLTEISKFLEEKNNAWLDSQGKGKHGWEEVPYWLKGYINLAYLLEDQKMIDRAHKWVEGILGSQRENGWFGPVSSNTELSGGSKTTGTASRGAKYDLWPNMVALFALQSYYEHTQDKRVLKLMRDYFKWESRLSDKELLPPYWQKMRAGDNLWSVYWLYNRTGEKWLLDLAERIQKNTAGWDNGVVSMHNVNIAQAFDTPGIYYQQAKKQSLLKQAEKNYKDIREQYGQVPGGMFGGDEVARPGYDDPRQAIETCGIVEQMLSNEQLLRVSGDVRWADRNEEVAYNMLPAAFMPDYSGLHYLTSPNLALANGGNHHPGIQRKGPKFNMNPHSYRCCQHNAGQGWPYFTQHLWLATPDKGLATAMYAPSKVTAKVADGKEVTIEQTTKYPFREAVTMHVSMDGSARFPLYLRVPRWCASPKVTINGESVSIDGKSAGRYVRIERQWSDGEAIELTLPMELRVKRWKKNHNSASVSYGPLTYSLRIGHNYVKDGGTKQWPAYDIRPTTPWNYGLVLNDNNPAASFEVKQRDWPKDDQPFTLEGAPIAIKAKAKRIPDWQLDQHDLVQVLQDSPVRSDQPTETVTLIPMGAARLRISAFPVIGSGPGAHRWKAPTMPAEGVSASHVYHNDTLAALKDTQLPNNSADTRISRFTWWPRKGGAQWVQYRFMEPKTVSRSQVYWFDDTEKGGGCALPASWQLLYKKGDQWKPVPSASGYNVAGDRFNNVSFKPVTTKAIRLKANLKQGQSAGILEWRVNGKPNENG